MSLDLERATSLIIERAGQLANRLIEEGKNDTPPFSPEEFARLLCVTRIEKTDLGEGSALLLKGDGGYVIKVNANHHPLRQNFSCAHELGHIIFNELGLEPYLQSIEHRGFNAKATRFARAKAREHLCDVAAAALLMPESVFRKHLLDFDISISSIERLANLFKVSRQTAAIRIAEVSPEPCLALLWKPLTKNNLVWLRLVWRAGRRINSQNRVNYMPKHVLVKPPSTLHKAYKANGSTKSIRKFVIDKAEKYLRMESKGFGRGETKYVISLAFLDR